MTCKFRILPPNQTNPTSSAAHQLPVIMYVQYTYIYDGGGKMNPKCEFYAGGNGSKNEEVDYLVQMKH